MKTLNIAIHRVYAPKKSEASNDGFLNDRRVTGLLRRLNGIIVEYESPSVVVGVMSGEISVDKEGRKSGSYSFRDSPSTKQKAHCSLVDFEQWAEYDVTELMPKRGWRRG